MFDTIVIASGNAGKILELRDSLAGVVKHLPTRTELGIDEPDEPHVTFFENALAKARHTARQAKAPALADDSGLVVPALNNAPGVRSARYAGEEANDADNNAKLLSAMDGVADRRAFYYAAIVLVNAADDPAPVFAEGLWHGQITAPPRGQGGFGYDPVFLDPVLNKTGAEMTLSEKQERSHRGKSLRAILRQLGDRRPAAPE
jgi:XTP/dITP diphosphohydrolase